MLQDLPPSSSPDKIKSVLPSNLSESVNKIWLLDDGKVALLKSTNETLVQEFLERDQPLIIGVLHRAKPSRANLLIRLPEYEDSDSYQPNRFEIFGIDALLLIKGQGGYSRRMSATAAPAGTIGNTLFSLPTMTSNM